MASAKAEIAASSRIESLVEAPYRTKLLLVGALTATMFVTTMNMTVMATSAQNIVADIGGFELFAWLFAGFSLTSAIAIPIVGKLTDIYGGKRVITVSLALFVLSSGVAGGMQSMPQLIAARAVQGISFAGSLGSVWIIMAALWPPRDRAKWIGVISAGFTLSGVLGPVIGGVISDNLSWRWVFWINVPTCGAALLMLLNWYPEVHTKRRSVSFDFAGAIVFGIAASAALYAFSVGGKAYAWTSPQVAGLFAVSVLATGLFVIIERRASDPMAPLYLFKARIFSGGLTASLTVTINFAVIMVFLPLFVQGVRGGSATSASFPLMAMAVGVAFGANLSGQIASRFGYAGLMAIGGLLVSAGGLAWIATMSGDTPDVLLYAVMLIMGTGMSFSFTNLHTPVQNAMPEEALGVVTSGLHFSRTFGTALGAAVLSAVLLSQLGPAPLDGPAAGLASPETLVSPDRLDEIRLEFIANPNLGEDSFRAELADARNRLSFALSRVFWTAAVISVFGGAAAAFAFSRLGIRGSISKVSSARG